MSRRLLATFAGIAVVGLLAATPASASSYHGDSCTAQPNVTVYKGSNRAVFVMSGNTPVITTITYDFGPSNSASKSNNQNFKINDGSNSSSEQNSGDNLIRDDTWRNNRTGLYYAVSNSATVSFTDIFDVPNNPDPRCNAEAKF